MAETGLYAPLTMPLSHCAVGHVFLRARLGLGSHNDLLAFGEITQCLTRIVSISDGSVNERDAFFMGMSDPFKAVHSRHKRGRRRIRAIGAGRRWSGVAMVSMGSACFCRRRPRKAARELCEIGLGIHRRRLPRGGETATVPMRRLSKFPPGHTSG